MRLLAYQRLAAATLLLALPLAVLAIGCGEGEPIRHYSVAKEAQRPAVADRMVGAILPAGERAWFFKVVGPAPAVEQQADELDEFLASIELTDDGRATWKLPDEWKEEEGTGIRAATILIPADDKPLELTVTTLSWRGTPEDLVSNINRWREQMGLPEVSGEQLGEVTRERQVGDETMTILDVHGRFDGGPAMTPPFAGRAGAGDRLAEGELPPGHPPVRPESQRYAGTPAPSDDAPQFKAPESWQQLPAAGIRKAAFLVGDEDNGALVTVISFPTDAGPQITDLLHNVNRWRHVELGLPEIDRDELDDQVETLKIDGHTATYAKIYPDPEKPQEAHFIRATLAAMVTVGDQVWFFKMTGNHEMVAAQQAEFESFLKSVRFGADAGEPDGDR